MKIGRIGGSAAILCIAMLCLSCACRSGSKRALTVARQDAPTVVTYGYRIINVYPHDPEAFTQGLFWHDGYLWESTGIEGQSELRQVRLETGEVVRRVALEDHFFGEGAAYLDGSIFQLTWKHGVAFVYDAETLEERRRFRYQGEGWGLTTDGQALYMSNGSSKIFVVDPSDFSRRRAINVHMGRANVRNINELEWIEGRIWANIYPIDSIFIIDPETGWVEGVVDLGGLLPDEEWTPLTDVLNGIAYDAETGRIFVTGKRWPRLFEIEIYKK
ncbi:MAG: glutaminyl-peptide cyclotransferase [Rikenellaceae bacterium]|nr:glutaminyl-peptide cyclotransferase [Rikenellaceae bacterium]MCL2693265.1 glutaminyl-peptide cyclotransferase [Rikenellaceae bacterium]